MFCGKPAGHSVWSSAVVCGADLPSGSAKSHAGVAAGRACIARQACLWHYVRGSLEVPFWWRGFVAERERGAQSAPASASQGTPQPSTDINALISEAAKDFADYQRLTAAGKLGEAGQKLDALKGALERLNAHGR